jgi:uncharacterized protein
MPGVALHRDVESAAYSKQGFGASFEIVLHLSQSCDAGFRNRINNKHWKISNLAASASSSYRGSAARRNRVLASEALLIPILESSQGVTFAVKINPHAKKNAITGEVDNALKVSLTAPPVDGKANKACLEFFANLLNVPRSSITIASSQTSCRKAFG